MTDDFYLHYYLHLSTEKIETCLACSNTPQDLNVDDPNTTTLDDLIKILCDSQRFQLKSPVKNIEEQTRANLTMSLAELGLYDGPLLWLVISICPPQLH
ncbi:unnamed protein product [Ceratitis capitata]|uniref:(Mediterranean fruit fly) hypothetical protein n=1 Tax=Ceratitis capitata TaxID=7213 RepID=A0A811UYN0_CERCA|nr:unnamed protein product [Ceratitis capitata]